MHKELDIKQDIKTLRSLLMTVARDGYFDPDYVLKLKSIDDIKKGEIKKHYNNILLAIIEDNTHNLIYSIIQLLALLMNKLPIERGKGWYRVGRLGQKHKYTLGNKVYREKIKRICETERLYS